MRSMEPMRRTSPMPRFAAGSNPGSLQFAALALVVLVVGHDLTFLSFNGLDGLGIALRQTGHDAYWPFTWLVAVLGVVALATIAVTRAARLLRSLNSVTPGSFGEVEPYARRFFRLWPRLAVVALAAFLLQEGVEHYVAHAGHLIGLREIVVGEYAAALPAFAFASGLVAAVASLFGHAIEVLEAAVRRAAHRPRRALRGLPHPSQPLLVRIRTSLATPDLGRAPPPSLLR